MFNTSKNRDSDNHSGVNCDSKIEVPEIQLSYKSTGAINIVTPKAFTIPATVRKKKFFHFIFPSACFKVIHNLLSFSAYIVSYDSPYKSWFIAYEMVCFYKGILSDNYRPSQVRMTCTVCYYFHK